ncbi:hypothetical protein ISF_07861 [Cordyceps fumosorosea ARSEF 2679]|uniref:DUF221 domain protein n=1 Tax=Cordyceps fumosorosea (strain ARSEF 2679) TaxID=1081104 RepID=A0A167NNJ8_CORFA|nr:hypothetical protein ISF_07861 [Cordyceps fumosorosea ARSEF 2679]OAA55756.1 hypothetical protein ISF_07861 [Cordyceps fumosorosea ARSEF 2679]
MRNHSDDKCTNEDWARYVSPGAKSKDLQVQLALSLILGVSALITFCILRPRWPALYSARKRRLHPSMDLPALPKTFFGWMPKLYSITEEQVLSSAGLDAFVFLSFFKMAIRLFCVMGFFALVVLGPINYKYRQYGIFPPTDPHDGDNATAYSYHPNSYASVRLPFSPSGVDDDDEHKDKSRERAYLWSYVIFTYFFVGLTLYTINWETFRIIKLRQEYLGSQSTVTDRTFRLSGIPVALRFEAKLKAMIEKLGVGSVETVFLCREWKELDELVEERQRLLNRLETAWARYQDSQHPQNSDLPIPDNPGYSDDSRVPDTAREPDEEAGENWGLLQSNPEQPHLLHGVRPQVVLGHGFLGLRRQKVDAIDYYEEKLRRADEKVVEARKQQYTPSDMALVTMDSVAACQMLIQAEIDPRPGQFLTKATPSPSDMIWKNTYAPRGVRRLKAWAITLFITILTLVWIFPTAFLASWLSICTIRNVMPAFATWLEDHEIIKSLIQTGGPTLVVSLLNIAVPYLYDFLSNHQGMISQGDVELSLISKNFFFTFFNTFFVFAISKTGLDFYSSLQGLLKDTSKIPAIIAADVENLSRFYISFIMLQGIGLMPFRILEVGSVVLYPIYRFLAVTPRDLAQLQKPPNFQYGFYLPTSLLVFNLCFIYSALMPGPTILVFGIIYFALGYFTFKYMLLYAMDQPQHATGGAWRIICSRLVIGILVFEVVMVGQIASLSAFFQSVSILPLIPFTVWYSYYFTRRFEPLTKYIALRAIVTGDGDDEEAIVDDEEEDSWEEGQDRPLANGASSSGRLLRRGSTMDELREQGLSFVNPSLVSPLLKAWIYKDPPPVPGSEGSSQADGSSRPSRGSSREPRLILPNADSSLGIGEDNVWRESRDG